MLFVLCRPKSSYIIGSEPNQRQRSYMTCVNWSFMLIFSFSSLFLLFLTPSIYFLYLLLSLFYRFSSCSLFSWPLKLIYAYSLGWGFHPSTTSVLGVSDGGVLFSFIPPTPLSLFFSSQCLTSLIFFHFFFCRTLFRFLKGRQNGLGGELDPPLHWR